MKGPIIGLAAAATLALAACASNDAGRTPGAGYGASAARTNTPDKQYGAGRDMDASTGASRYSEHNDGTTPKEQIRQQPIQQR